MFSYLIFFIAVKKILVAKNNKKSYVKKKMFYYIKNTFSWHEKSLRVIAAYLSVAVTAGKVEATSGLRTIA